MNKALRKIWNPYTFLLVSLAIWFSFAISSVANFQEDGITQWDERVETFKKVKTETFLITNSVEVKKWIPGKIPGTYDAMATGKITLIQGKEVYYLTVPIEEFPFFYAGLELTLHIGEDESVVLSEDGNSYYHLEKAK